MSFIHKVVALKQKAQADAMQAKAKAQEEEAIHKVSTINSTEHQ